MSRRRLFVGAALVAIIAVVVGLIMLGGPSKHATVGSVCADVGIVTETGGGSPPEGVASFVRSKGGDPRDWMEAAPAGGYVAYRRRVRQARPSEYALLLISEVSPGLWRVSGACV
jgi:hypothetical protein